VSRGAGLVVLLWLCLAAFAWMLGSFWRADDRRAEQVAIGLGARMGNGLLLSALAWSVLVVRGASIAEASGFTGLLAATFFLSFATLATRPHDAVIGYKG